MNTSCESLFGSHEETLTKEPNDNAEMLKDASAESPDDSDEYIDLDISDVVQEAVDTLKIAPKKSKCRIFETFTKLWVSLLMINAIIDMNLSYVLAFLGRDQIAETLSIAVVTEIIGVMAVYLIRAFLDTHFEAKDAIEHKKLDVYSLMNNIQGSSTSSESEEDVPEVEPDIDDELDDDGEEDLEDEDDTEADG